MADMIEPNKSVTVASGNTYAYISIPAADASKPTLLFLHGFPSSSYDWRFQVPYFASLGYGLIVPDLLGYGGSSKPTDPAAYTGLKITADMIALLDHEKVTGRLVGIAHDWGTFLLSRLAVFHGERFDKYVFVSVPFSGPKIGSNGNSINYQDVLHINAATEQMLGYSCFGYWLFFNEPDAGKVIGEHWESFYDILYAADPALWKKHIGPVGALKSFITSDSHVELGSYITPEAKAHHQASFAGDYSAPICWYKRSMADLGAEEERIAIERGEVTSWKSGSKLEKETLFVAGTEDAVCLAEMGKQSQGVEKDKLTIVDVKAGHWIMLEQAGALNRAIEKFLTGSASASSSL